MIIEKRGKIPPPERKRFECRICHTQFIAEGEGKEWFPHRLQGTEKWYFTAYCPVCGHEVHTR